MSLACRWHRTDKSRSRIDTSIAAKTGSQIVSPANDLMVEDKRISVSGYKFSDMHQMDALASAILHIRVSDTDPKNKKIAV
jgi:hypothetical protein